MRILSFLKVKLIKSFLPLSVSPKQSYLFSNSECSNSRNFFVYQTGANRKYEERYLNFEVTQIEPNYQGTIIQSTLNGISAKKITLPNIQFDIYSIKLSSGEFIEIYVSNNVNKKDVVDQILSTFKFIE